MPDGVVVEEPQRSGRIQVDMFDVQLGGALLIQMTDQQGQVVRILGDAGILKSVDKPNRVQKLLPGAFEAFDPRPEREKRIDLMVGTHYDEDHLRGLVPVAEDLSIHIAEAWMPPVTDDTVLASPGSTPADDAFLAQEFAQPDGYAQLDRYLEVKRRECDGLAALQNQLTALLLESAPALVEAVVVREHPLADDRSGGGHGIEDERLVAFRAHASDGAEVIGVGEPDLADEEAFRLLVRLDEFAFAERRPDLALRIPRFGGAEVLLRARSLVGAVRKSSAEDAITATYLHDIVHVLGKRNVPVRTHKIDDGKPSWFSWNPAQRTFMRCAERPDPGQPLIGLLAPSEALVKKHWARLPVLGPVVAALAYRAIDLLGVEPSNQLSYALTVSTAGQTVLVSGDSGCDGFAVARGKKYSPHLLEALRELHVIQVAHHGGRNGHFYRVLLESEYLKQSTPSFLLLSHATRDKTRLSEEFRQFVEQLESAGNKFQILFTSAPEAMKVGSFRHRVHPVVHGVPEGVDSGDVRLLYDGASWAVKKHAVAV
jgi:hypothetical protein